MKVHVGDRVSYKAEYSCGQLIREAGVGKVVDIKKSRSHCALKKMWL